MLDLVHATTVESRYYFEAGKNTSPLLLNMCIYIQRYEGIPHHYFSMCEDWCLVPRRSRRPETNSIASNVPPRKGERHSSCTESKALKSVSIFADLDEKGNLRQNNEPWVNSPAFEISSPARAGGRIRQRLPLPTALVWAHCF